MQKPSIYGLPEDIDIVLDCELKGYYIVSWAKMCILWLQDVDATLVTDNARTEQHLGKCFFWYYSTLA